MTYIANRDWYQRQLTKRFFCTFFTLSLAIHFISIAFHIVFRFFVRDRFLYCTLETCHCTPSRDSLIRAFFALQSLEYFIFIYFSSSILLRIDNLNDNKAMKRKSRKKNIYLLFNGRGNFIRISEIKPFYTDLKWKKYIRWLVSYKRIRRAMAKAILHDFSLLLAVQFRFLHFQE